VLKFQKFQLFEYLRMQSMKTPTRTQTLTQTQTPHTQIHTQIHTHKHTCTFTVSFSPLHIVTLPPLSLPPPRPSHPFTCAIDPDANADVSISSKYDSIGPPTAASSSRRVNSHPIYSYICKYIGWNFRYILHMHIYILICISIQQVYNTCTCEYVWC